MLSSRPEHDALRDITELEASVNAVETYLAALGQALQAQDPAATEQCADLLHRSLTTAVRRFAESAGQGRLPPELRRRLALTTGQVAAQRDAVARATSALDRAIDILLPSGPAQAPTVGLYGARGTALRATYTGQTQA